MTKKTRLLLVASLLLSAAATAQQAAHVHGEAQLTLAAMDNELHIEFESPAANLVGFEYAPRNQQEKQALKLAAGQLAGAERFLQFEGTECRLQVVAVEAPHSDDDAHAEQPGHDHAHHDHAKHAGHSDHGGHAGHAEHASFRASYRFSCANLAQLEGVKVILFTSFPEIHEINAQWLTSGQQGAATLTAQRNELLLK